jgi:hypothetical protein
VRPTREQPFPIEAAPGSLLERYRSVLWLNADFERQMVSFQDNKALPFHRWFKYKEAFSTTFVDYVLDIAASEGLGGAVLDPFAGIGTTLFSALVRGRAATGIEMLEPALFAMEAKLQALRTDPEAIAEGMSAIEAEDLGARADRHKPPNPFARVAITRGAFPSENERELLGFMHYCRACRLPDSVRYAIALAGMSVLEETSYTRKDGQYLRWDGRAPGRGGHFRKDVAPFKQALMRRLFEIGQDLQRPGVPELQAAASAHRMEVIRGSCLNVLPTLEDGTFGLVVTSPPYCNRYDYTRTYALELVYLGYGDAQIRQLRQELLTATVENRPKIDLRERFSSAGRGTTFRRGEEAFEQQAELQQLIGQLEMASSAGALNNTNVPRMVRNYFFEMAIVIQELSRVTRAGGLCTRRSDLGRVGPSGRFRGRAHLGAA